MPISTSVLIAVCLLALVAAAVYGTLPQQALAILVCIYTAGRLVARGRHTPSADGSLRHRDRH